MRGKTRYIKLLKTFEDKSCGVCGEIENHRLRWYPHHTTIHSHYTRWGPNTEQRQQADELIQECRIVCANCESDIHNALVTNQELPFYI